MSSSATSEAPKALGDDYVFSRGVLDDVRINLQHYLWTEIFGYRIHPSIPTTAPGLRIADVGCGTCAWLGDLSTKLPASTRLTGFDIDFTSAPHASWLPANLELVQWDVTTPPPAAHEGMYDIVNVRLFMYVVRGNLDLILDNLVKLLKPGGHLQWSEADIHSMRIAAPEGVSGDAIVALGKLVAAQDERTRPTWVRGLAGTFKAHGLLDVSEEWCDGSAINAFMLHEANLLIYEIMTRFHANKEFVGEVQRHLPTALKQTGDGAMFRFERGCIVGRRA